MSFWNHDALAASLRRAIDPPAAPSAAAQQLEATRSVTWIALSVRQLADAGVLSNELQRAVWPVHLHWPIDGTLCGPAEAPDFSSFYEMTASRTTVLTTMRVCGMLIHSLVLAPVADEAGAPTGVFFNTTLTRDQGVFRLGWEHLALLVDATCDEIAGSGVIHGR